MNSLRISSTRKKPYGVDKSKLTFGLSYIETGSPLHRLSGFTKLVLFLWWITLILTTFDLRVLTGFFIVGIVLLSMAQIPFKVYRPFVFFMVYIVTLNSLFIYLFAPLQGPEFIGSHTELFVLTKRYVVTLETLVYLAVIAVKFLAIFPMSLLFVFSTHPTEFAASLNKIKVPYQIAYAVSLTLRYLPEITKDFINILHAQQARGVDISRNVSLRKRIRNIASILFPLILSSLEKADVITNAMTLRGFGKGHSRTWYNARPMATGDWFVLAAMAVWTVPHFIIRASIDGLFWYPF